LHKGYHFPFTLEFNSVICFTQIHNFHGNDENIITLVNHIMNYFQAIQLHTTKTLKDKSIKTERFVLRKYGVFSLFNFYIVKF
jgi:hypothetical protein